MLPGQIQFLRLAVDWESAVAIADDCDAGDDGDDCDGADDGWKKIIAKMHQFIF